MKIGRLHIRLQGSAADARNFSRYFRDELKRLDLPDGPRGQLARLDLAPVTAQPGDGPRRLAQKTAQAVATALRQQQGGPNER